MPGTEPLPPYQLFPGDAQLDIGGTAGGALFEQTRMMATECQRRGQADAPAASRF